MAKVIEFYVPACFRKVVKWVPQEERGRVLEFAVSLKRTA
jgi:sugar phosphate permease